MSSPNSSKEQKSGYFFFWKSIDGAGWASQWYRSPFTTDIDGKETTFITCEHWMMYQKAILFGDKDVAEEVLAVNGTSQTNMGEVKKLGRKVKDFDQHIWEKERMRIVLEGNRLKFGQNQELKDKLLGTGHLEIVEASPMDRIWGIGFGAKNAELVKNKKRWGMNLLGQALQIVREEFKDAGEDPGPGDNPGTSSTVTESGGNQ